jgi:hypothetical protein
MPAPAFSTLYELVAEGVPYHSASLILCTLPVLRTGPFEIADLGEPAVAGYTRWTEASLLHIFPGPQIVVGQRVAMASRQWSLQNRGPTPIDVTGVALVVNMDASTPIILAVVAAATRWDPNARISGRFRLETLIYVQGA